MHRNVLIIDDNVSVTQIVKALLQRWDYDVEIANDPHLVLPMLEKRPFDLVISDVMMPGMDGFTLGQKIREQPATATLPIVFLTALDSVEDQFEAWMSGGSAFLTKPFRAQDLLKAIDEAMSSSARAKGITNRRRTTAPVERARVLGAVLEHERRRMITAAMHIADCDLDFSEDVEGALQRLDRDKFHALICDTRLAGASPQRISEFMRHFALAIPVVFLHADAAPDLAGCGSQFSAFALPDSPSVLGAHVRNAIDDSGWAT